MKAGSLNQSTITPIKMMAKIIGVRMSLNFFEADAQRVADDGLAGVVVSKGKERKDDSELRDADAGGTEGINNRP